MDHLCDQGIYIVIVVQVNMAKEGTGHWMEFLKKIEVHVVVGCRSHVRVTYY